MPFLSSTPRCNTELFSIDECLKLPAFQAVWEASRNTGSVRNCEWDDNRKAEWRNAIREGVISCAGDNVDINFFNEMFGGNIETVDAKNLYTKYMCDVDYNVAAQSNAVGSAPGAGVWFTLARGYHSTGGKYSYPAKGMSIYIYQDGMQLYIDDIDRTTDNAHRFHVIPYRAAYTVNIRRGTPLLVVPARIVGGDSCPMPSTTMQTPGYISKTSPMRLRKDWCTKVDLMRGYQDILQWAIMFDKDGKEIDCWITYEKIKAMEQMQLAENIAFFLGNQIDNPELLGVTIDQGYTGFDGYLPTLKYAGGYVYDYDPTQGFSLEFDYGNILLRQDSFKQTKEFQVVHGKPFMVNMVRNSNEFLKNQVGACTFEAYKRMPDDGIKKYDITSYRAFGHTLHFKEWGVLSDSRLLGNYDMRNLAIMVPATGLHDSKGKSVSAMEFYVPKGCGESGALEEHQTDMRDVTQCEEIKGYVAKTLMMQIHCPKLHILLNPVTNC